MDLFEINDTNSSLLGATTSSLRGTPRTFRWNRGGIDVLSRKPAISLNYRTKVTIDDQNEVAYALWVAAKINDLG